MTAERTLGVWRGAALYVGALIGPGVLLVPALAAQAAGPASILAWAGLLVFSAPLAIAFAALGVRHPVAGGVSAYVREGFGEARGRVTGGCFLAAVLIGSPAVSLIGGYYVADLTGSGTAVAAAVGLAIFARRPGRERPRPARLVGISVRPVLGADRGDRRRARAALPSRAGDNWTPFAPHGWWAAGTAASILVWLFVGWEAVAQLAGDFRRPGARPATRDGDRLRRRHGRLHRARRRDHRRDRPHAARRVPLADLIAVGFGRAGRDATAVLAVALTMGTMNVYIGGAAKLAASLAHEGALPRWLGGATPPRAFPAGRSR